MSSPHMVARFFVRSDGRLILGGADPRPGSHLKAGFVYEILSLPSGELTLEEVGPSCASVPDAMARFGLTDATSPDALLAKGFHLLTPEEMEARRS